MAISMYAMSIDVFVPMLNNLSSILDKGARHAEAKKFDTSVLVNARLAPDMLPLAKQVQLASDFAKNSVARLIGKDPPRFEDNETTLEELKTRIARTLEYLASVRAADMENAEQRDVKVPLRDGPLELKGLPFLQHWALPNFFFHVTTAYDILRHNGAEIGKRDFLWHVRGNAAR
jgi:uncharacterized protein